MVKSIARKRKRQFYGNKFTNTSKKNSTSTVPECTASCSKSGNETFSTTEEMPGPVFGNRIVDLELIVEAFAQLCCPKCFAEKVELFEDFRYGLCSHFTLKSELAERWTEIPQVSDESRSFFRVHTGYFSNIPKCIKAEFIASWGCSQSSVVSSSQR
ncbi:hypothetical protein TNCV_2218401 [Trichonephila clavipes]|nr:hypothetical protein TNCV_2218401 [Trichonephila clavipes]